MGATGDFYKGCFIEELGIEARLKRIPRKKQENFKRNFYIINVVILLIESNSD